eukprot:scaffold17830_cov32-Tisochrysis_lutea.AAC.2
MSGCMSPMESSRWNHSPEGQSDGPLEGRSTHATDELVVCGGTAQMWEAEAAHAAALGRKSCGESASLDMARAVS